MEPPSERWLWPISRAESMRAETFADEGPEKSRLLSRSISLPCSRRDHFGSGPNSWLALRVSGGLVGESSVCVWVDVPSFVGTEGIEWGCSPLNASSYTHLNDPLKNQWLTEAGLRAPNSHLSAPNNP
ncbi:hypothetical protein LBW62_25510, partial [Ralstonia solanacearum]